MIAFLLALAAAAALALLLDALDSTFRTREEAEQRLALPFLGPVPHVDGECLELGAADNPTSPLAECCRVIRTNLLYAGLKQPIRRILLTSSLPREGKTLTSVSLGVVMAQAGNKILLVETDLRKPRLQAALGLPRDFGLTDVLIGKLTLDEAIQPTAVPNLSVLLAGGVPPNPAEILEGPGFRALLDSCSERFDRVLLDSPPALPVADPAILAALCDGVILIVRAGQTSVVHARRARQILTDTGARMLGIILNDAGKGTFGYGYGYGYGYGPEDGEQPRRRASSSATG